MRPYWARGIVAVMLLGVLLAGCAQIRAERAAARQTYQFNGKSYRSEPEAIKAAHALMDEQVATVPQASDTIKGRTLVILPDRDRLRPIIVEELGNNYSEPGVAYLLEIRRIYLQAEVDGLQRSRLFETIDVVERNDTEEPDFAGHDYLIWYKVSTTGPNHTGKWYGLWQIRRAPDATAETASVDVGVPPKERIASWVKSVRTAAVNLGAPAGSGATTDAASGARGNETGIVISASGHIVTNNHGVKACRGVRVRAAGEIFPASVVAQDALNDLALLKAEHGFAATAKFRDATPIRQGETIVALGYPLAGLIGIADEAIVTTGTVSALTGFRNDTRFLQISAPVQPGNSGGPLLDGSGLLAGIVSQKLDAFRFALATGELPQNVNFAIKRTVVENFLDANGVSYATAAPSKEASPADIAAAAKRFTLKVECL